jgi:hypothetical protein
MNNTPKLDNCKIFWKQVLTLSTALNILKCNSKKWRWFPSLAQDIASAMPTTIADAQKKGSGYDGQAKMKEDCQSSLLSSLNGTITDAIMLSTISCAKGYHTSQRTLK